MTFARPIDATVQILKYDKFGVLRPESIVGKKFANIPHSGVDLRPHQYGGTKNVYAIDDGVIMKSTTKDGSYYNIRHTNGFSANYVHMATRPLKRGTKVKKGQLIGTYSSHLHLTLFKGGVMVNPTKYINMTTPTYKEINFKLLEDFANSKDWNSYFGKRIDDYKALENKKPGEGVRERIRVLINQIKKRDELIDLAKAEIAEQENNIIETDSTVIPVVSENSKDKIIDTLQDTIKDQEKEINQIVSGVYQASQMEKWSWNKFWVGLSKYGVIDGVLGFVIAYLLSLSSLAEFQEYAIYFGLGISFLKSLRQNIKAK